MAYYSPKPIHLKLRPSTLLTSLLILAGLIACIALTLLLLPGPLVSVLIALVVLMVTVAIRRHALLAHSTSIVMLRLHGDGSLEISLKNGNRHAVRVLPDSFAGYQFAVLNLQLEQTTSLWAVRRHLVLLSDHCDPEEFRRMRVWLRWGRQSSSQQ
jgi:hypothetical protein